MPTGRPDKRAQGVEWPAEIHVVPVVDRDADALLRTRLRDLVVPADNKGSAHSIAPTHFR